MSEADWQAQVVQLAGMLGWRHCHTRRSIGRGRKWTTATSVIGWPDLVLWHEQQQRLLFIELKATAGRLADTQREVLLSLRAAGQEVAVWRPEDLEAIQETLAGAPLTQVR